MARKRKMDAWLLAAVLVLTIGGFFIFASASLGLLAKEGPMFSDVVMDQLLFGLIGGLTALVVTAHIPYRMWRRYAFYILGISIILTALVFIPGLGISHGGATRWLDLGVISFQPTELLKFGVIVYLAAWLAQMRQKLHHPLYGLLPVLVLLGIAGGLLMPQPDTDAFVIIAGTAVAMFFVAGAKWRDILVIAVLGAVALGAMVGMNPYLIDRVQTYMNPMSDPLGSGYQIRQSLIAIGSGEITGRGFGQSIQKFNFLPEPIGDSIYAVAAEEFGFIGSIAIIIVYLAFALRGMQIAARAPDPFARTLVIGIVVLIVIQSLLNIAAMLNVIPLSGMPLLFISHGGTALAVTLAEVGIVLNISKHMKSPKRV